MSDWTPEEKDDVVARYNELLAEYETPEDKGNAGTEICSKISQEIGKTVNAVRIILVQAGVYQKKVTTKKAATGGGSTGGARVNKAQAHEDLKATISTLDSELVDEEVISKLTGKAAQYITSVLQKALQVQE